MNTQAITTQSDLERMWNWQSIHLERSREALEDGDDFQLPIYDVGNRDDRRIIEAINELPEARDARRRILENVVQNQVNTDFMTLVSQVSSNDYISDVFDTFNYPIQNRAVYSTLHHLLLYSAPGLLEMNDVLSFIIGNLDPRDASGSEVFQERILLNRDEANELVEDNQARTEADIDEDEKRRKNEDRAIADRLRNRNMWRGIMAGIASTALVGLGATHGYWVPVVRSALRNLNLLEIFTGRRPNGGSERSTEVVSAPEESSLKKAVDAFLEWVASVFDSWTKSGKE